MNEPGNKMTEAEFEDQLMVWAESGHFDQDAPLVKIVSGFKWMHHAESEYCRFVNSEYKWIGGLKFKISASSKVNGIELHHL